MLQLALWECQSATIKRGHWARRTSPNLWTNTWTNAPHSIILNQNFGRCLMLGGQANYVIQLIQLIKLYKTTILSILEHDLIWCFIEGSRLKNRIQTSGDGFPELASCPVWFLGLKTCRTTDFGHWTNVEKPWLSNCLRHGQLDLFISFISVCSLWWGTSWF